MKTVWAQVAAGIIIAMCAASLGYGYSQREIAIQVMVNARDLALLRQDVSEEKKRTDERIFNLASLMKASIEQSGQLISLIRLQQQMQTK